MEESEVAGSVATAGREIGSPQGKKATKPGRFTFASYVDSIKVGLRKISSYKDSSGSARRKETVSLSRKQTQEPFVVSEERRPGGIVVGVKRKKERSRGEANCEGTASKKTSFEMFLLTLPKCDPVDRTVGWVYQQPVERSEEPKSLSALPQRGAIVPLPQPPITQLSSMEYETSVSYCESERGTHGRGTPPSMDMSQPRLDDLFRQLHVKQEHQARREMAKQGEAHLTSRNLRDIESAQVLGYPPGVTLELLPFLSRVHGTPYKREPSILHKNSFYYQQVGVVSRHDGLPLPHFCEWGSCTAKFTTSKELFEHVHNEHISLLPSYLSKYKVRSSRDRYQLMCRWKRCWEMFDARYKLLLHLQNCHFKEQKTHMTKIEAEEHPTLEPDLAALSPPTQDKHTHPHRRPLHNIHIQHYPTEHNSVHMTSYPLNRQGPQSRRKRGADHRSTLHSLQPERTPHARYRPTGR